jgi:chromosome segregation ATPase
MNFSSLMKRYDNVEKAAGDLQTELAEALDSALSLEDASSSEGELISEEALPIPDDVLQIEDTSVQATCQLTSHTQSRLAAINSFAKLFHETEEHLDEIKARVLEVATSQHYAREFFNILQSDILRANELEVANANLVAEQKVLSEQLHEAKRKHRDRESAFGAMQERETGLVHDRDALRGALAAVRLELVEVSNTGARKEAELGEVLEALSTRTAELNRCSRENEALREKQVRLSIDVDKAQKREAEARRRLDELSSLHLTEAARHSELLAALGRSEKEEARLQKSLEMEQAKLSEMTEAARMMEDDWEAELARGLAEMRGLRSELQNLQSRLDAATSENREASTEIAKITAQLRDAAADKLVADERLAALMEESEADKKHVSVLSADLSQLSVQYASEQMQLDVQRQECEDLRGEIASLSARVKELLPYERVHKVANARERQGMAPVGGAVADPPRVKARRRARAPQPAAS